MSFGKSGASDNFYADNDERAIFFCKGVLETVRKLGWAMFITKPIMSGWGLGFKMWNLYDFNTDEWDKYINSKWVEDIPKPKKKPAKKKSKK